MMREERDDDDNESAVRALNTALTQQALSLQDLHDDPLMTDESSGTSQQLQPMNQNNIMSMEHNLDHDDDDDAGSDAPSDENGDQTSSLLGFDNTSMDMVPLAVPTMDSTDSSEASSMAGLAILADLQASSRHNTTNTDNDTSVDRSTPKEDNGIADQDDIHNTDKSMNEDGMHEELERLRVSEQVLREQLTQAEQAATAAAMSSPLEKLSQAAAQVFAADDPPTPEELRAVASGANIPKTGGTGSAAGAPGALAPIIDPIVDRATNMDVGLVQETMETMMAGFVEGCQGYLEKAQQRSANKNMALTVFDPSQLSSSLFRQPDAGEGRPSDEDDSCSEESTSEGDEAPGLLNIMDGYGLGGLMLLASGGGENSSEDTSDILAEHAAVARQAQSHENSSGAVNNPSMSNDGSSPSQRDGMPRHIFIKGKRRKNSSQGASGGASNSTGSKTGGISGLLSKAKSRLMDPLGRKQKVHNTNRNAVSDVEDPSQLAEEGHEVAAFYQAKHQMSLWERVRSREQQDEWRKKLSEKHWFGIQRLYWVVFMGIALTMFLLLGILLLALFGGSSSNSADSGMSSTVVEPALSNTGPYNISIFPECSQVAIANNTSPQHQAFQWLTQDPTYQEYSDERILQRFALATLFYATDGPNWAFASGILSEYDREECLWFQTRSLRTTPATCSALNGGLIETLMLDNNNLKGSLPPEIFLLTNLKRISLENNELLSTIPEDGLWNMTRLEYFSLANTGVFGPIPTAFGSLPGLERLDLSSNQLSSTIPEDLAGLSNLAELRLQRNELTGTLPAALCSSFTNLTKLYLFENYLEGPIPTEIGMLYAMEELLLNENRMNSTLPMELGELTQLQHLWLDQNQFSGELPRQLGSLTELRQLNLYANDFSGTIPASMGRASSLEQVRLEDNQLTGSVPDRLCAAMPNDGDNDIVRILAIDCEEVECDCDCTCPRPGMQRQNDGK